MICSYDEALKYPVDGMMC